MKNKTTVVIAVIAFLATSATIAKAWTSSGWQPQYGVASPYYGVGTVPSGVEYLLEYTIVSPELHQNLNLYKNGAYVDGVYNEGFYSISVYAAGIEYGAQTIVWEADYTGDNGQNGSEVFFEIQVTE